MSQAHARATARDLISEFGIDNPDDIDIQAIAFSRGAFVLERRLLGSEGRLVRRGSKGIIAVDSTIREPGRKRFCVAHELAHFELHKLHDQLKFCTEEMLQEYTKLPDEQEANIFASELLMPETLFLKFAPARDPDATTLKELANRFGTSLTATFCRFVDVAVIECALIISSKGVVKWFKATPKFGFRVVDPGSRLHAHSCAGEYFSLSSEYPDPQSVPAYCWLVNLPSSASATITELTVPLPSYQTTLSLLWTKESDLESLEIDE